MIILIVKAVKMNTNPWGLRLLKGDDLKVEKMFAFNDAKEIGEVKSVIVKGGGNSSRLCILVDSDWYEILLELKIERFTATNSRDLPGLEATLITLREEYLSFLRNSYGVLELPLSVKVNKGLYSGQKLLVDSKGARVTSSAPYYKGWDVKAQIHKYSFGKFDVTVGIGGLTSMVIEVKDTENGTLHLYE